MVSCHPVGSGGGGTNNIRGGNSGSGVQITALNIRLGVTGVISMGGQDGVMFGGAFIGTMASGGGSGIHIVVYVGNSLP